jgi:phage terminase small subunit
MRKKLTAKQVRFVQEYLVDYNGTQAAIRAGYPAASARQVASENLSKPDIATAVNRGLMALQARCDVSADRVLLELARVAYADIRQIFDLDGRLIQPKDYNPAIAGAVVGVEVATRTIDEGEVEYIHKVKLAPKVEALKTLAQHLGLLKTTLTGPEGGAVPVRIVMEHEKG